MLILNVNRPHIPFPACNVETVETSLQVSLDNFLSLSFFVRPILVFLYHRQPISLQLT